MTKYKHECVEWDGLVIDLEDDEFVCCSCYNKDLIVSAIQKHINEKHDAIRVQTALELLTSKD